MLENALGKKAFRGLQVFLAGKGLFVLGAILVIFVFVVFFAAHKIQHDIQQDGMQRMMEMHNANFITKKAEVLLEEMAKGDFRPQQSAKNDFVETLTVLGDLKDTMLHWEASDEKENEDSGITLLLHGPPFFLEDSIDSMVETAKGLPWLDPNIAQSNNYKTVRQTLSQQVTPAVRAGYVLVAQQYRKRMDWVEQLELALLGFGVVSLTALISLIGFLVSRRGMAEKNLLQTEQRYGDIVEGALNGIMVLDGARPLFANEQAARIYGFSSAREMLLLPDLRHLVDEEFREWIAVLGHELLAGNEIPDTLEFRARKKNGDSIWVEARTRVVKWDGKDVLQISVSDVTRRREASQRADLLSAAVEQAQDSVFITDVNGTIEYVNPGFERISGYTSEEAIGQNPKFLKSGVQTESFYKDMWASLLAGRPWKGRYENRRKDGSIYEVETTNSPVYGRDGSITHFVSVQKDVSYQKGLEEQLRRTQRMEAIGNLAGGIAHDFNNLLMPIIGFTELALSRYDRESEDYRDMLEIRTAAYRAKDLVAQILLFSRKIETTREPMRLQDVAHEVLKLLGSTLPRNIEISINIAEDLPLVLADSTQMNQVLLNLCVNASQSMAEGGKLAFSIDQVSLERRKIFMGETISGTFVRIRVEDTGEGIATESLPHVFEPFFTTKEVGKGTGLGLSTVFGIVSQHNGYIDLTTEVGQGSVFEVFLLPVDAEEAVQKVTISALPRGEEQILIVDDEHPILEVMQRTLTSLGYKVTSRTDPLEALELLRSDPECFDLVITDYSMPGMSGAKLTTEIKALRNDIAIIMCTGFSENLSPEQALDLGVNEFAYKPLTMEELSKLVRRVLDNNERQRPAILSVS